MSTSADPLGVRSGSTALVTSKVDRPVVTTTLRVDGQTLSVALELDLAEGERRRRAGIGAVHRTGLLHALWTLPEGLSFPVSSVEQRDVETLRELGAGTVELDDTCAVRTYRPAGVVLAVGAMATSARAAVTAVGGYPTIFKRFALVSGATVDPYEVDRARGYGIGVSHLVDDEWVSVLEPGSAELGVPAVYRWWIAEIAYRNYLASEAHCTS